MKLRVQDVDILEGNPFANDCLGRSAFASVFTELVKSAGTPFVINLEASWGQGKTTFLKMWRQETKAIGINSLYINAWETDFSADPLVSLMGDLNSTIDEFKVPDESKAKAQLERLKAVGIGVLKRSIPAAVKLATMGVIDFSDATEEVLASFGEKVAEDQLARYKQGKESMAVFRRELEKFALETSSGAPPLVIIEKGSDPFSSRNREMGSENICV